MYIQPRTKVYASLEESKDDFDKYGDFAFSFFHDKAPLPFEEYAKFSRNLIVGEPGIGKTALLEKLQVYHDGLGHKTYFVKLGSVNPSQQIDECLADTVEKGKQKVLLLDALDEARATNLPGLLPKIEAVSKEHPEIIIHLSARWIFINKYSTHFPGYRFIVILPFSQAQVRQHLLAIRKYSEKEVDALLGRLMQFSHGQLVLQVPRYLLLLEKFIDEKSIAEVEDISRNELFEYFIYHELKIEDERLNTNSRAVIKRVLEKLALVMEIYQTNQISKDELMTFFDELDSDLKLVILSQVSLELFVEKTALEETHQDLEKIKFQNTEFQEYLAAKEISRLSEPQRATFFFAADINLKELYPVWFNTLTFLVDLMPEMLEPLIEFSGLESGEFKVADDTFFVFLSRVNPVNISASFKKKIFIGVMNYQEKTLQWLPGQLTSALPGFFSPDLEADLKAMVKSASSKEGTARFVVLANIAYVIAYLLKSNIGVDRPYWKEKLLSFVRDPKENGVLQRHAYLGLAELGEPSVIDAFPSYAEIDDDMVIQEFLGACITLDPENPKTLQYIIDAIKHDDHSARQGLLELKKRESIVFFLKALIDDDYFRKEFFEDASIWGDRDSKIVDNIRPVFDNEIRSLCEIVVAKAVAHYIGHSAKNSNFILGIMLLLKEKDPNFLPELLNKIKEDSQNGIGLYFVQDFFVEILEREDVVPYMEFLVKNGEENSAMSTMMKIKHSNRPNKEEIYEVGRNVIPEKYKEWEAPPKQNLSSKKSPEKEMLKEFRKLLEPEPGQFTIGVFSYYVRHADQLNSVMTKKDRDRLIHLITGSALKFDPSQHGLTIISQHDDGNGGTKEYTTNQLAHFFGDALIAARRLGLDVSEYRSNIALYIPFSHNEELDTIFDLVKKFTPDELARLIAIYKEHNTDLWRHQPDSFISAAQQYHVVEAVPALREFVQENGFRLYDRKEALQVVASLVPDPMFLKQIFDLYVNSESSDEKQIAETANGLLITIHGDKDALLWRIKEIKNRVVSYIPPRSGGVYNVGPVDEELRHNKPFAKPLIEFRLPGFEEDYLGMLDYAMTVYAKGADYFTYSQYIWDIVRAYFDSLKEYKKYEPLKLLEAKIASLKDKDGANWLASSMVQLRMSYLQKPDNISEAIRKYNEAKKYSNKNILNSADLFGHIKNAIQTDLKRWVEGEGAYSVIMGGEKFKGKKNEYEKLIQKTIKGQLELILRKRDIVVDITREEQLYDEKRTDLLVRYGFIGPIVLEIKLSSHADVRSSKIETTESYESMGRYMEGYNAAHGIFLIMDNTGTPHLARAISVYKKIPNVWAISLDCYSTALKKKKAKEKNTKPEAKKKSAVSKRPKKSVPKKVASKKKR